MKYLCGLFVILIIIFFALPLNRNILYPKDFCSFEICARNGEVLREVLSYDYKTSIWIPLEKMSPWLIKATILGEDKRFLLHPGFDYLALFRAFYGNIKYRKIISGGSTITMQVAKMVLGLKKRTITNKFIELIYALKLELHLSKKDILEIYLNRAPYGNQTYGVEAASRFYFHKPASHLSLSESCLLTAIPKDPTKLNPYNGFEKINNNRVGLLNILLKISIIDTLQYTIGLSESLNIVQKDINFKAPHFVDFILQELNRKKLKNVKTVVTSIDYELQSDFEKILYTTLESLKKYHVKQGAILVMDEETGEILVMIGSKDYFDLDAGQINGCTALRQPGSSIKPFLYILAVMSEIPASFVLLDTVMEFRLPDGTLFAPKNYGARYHGLIRLREALASSLNVPTVYLANMLGIPRFHEFLKQLHFESLNKDAAYYGLSLSLGAAENSLLELLNGYRSIAQAGVYEKEKTILKIIDVYDHQVKLKNDKPEHVFSPQVAYIMADILSDNASRIKSFGEDNPLNFPFCCAAKTGTSKDFRDNWCIGFTNKYIVGVWVGNFDGSPMQGVSGISGAAPLFRDIMMELHQNSYPTIFDDPGSLVRLNICAKSGKIATAYCPNRIEEIFIPGTVPVESCEMHDTRQEYRLYRFPGIITKRDIEFINPCNNDIFRLDPQVSYSAQAIKFKVHVADGIEEVIFKLDGCILGVKRKPFEYLWKPERGKHKLEVIAQDGVVQKSDVISFTIY